MATLTGCMLCPYAGTVAPLRAQKCGMLPPTRRPFQNSTNLCRRGKGLTPASSVTGSPRDSESYQFSPSFSFPQTAEIEACLFPIIPSTCLYFLLNLLPDLTPEKSSNFTASSVFKDSETGFHSCFIK